MKKTLFGLVTIALIAGLSACGNSDKASNAATTPASSPTTAEASPSSSAATTSSMSSGTKINVSETEMAIALSSKTVPAGPVDFVVKNDGQKGHELVVFKTDLPLDKLPTKDGKLDEDNPSLKNVVDSGEENIKGGEEKVLHATLTPGHYVVICNVGHHFEKGMKAELTVQ